MLEKERQIGRRVDPSNWTAGLVVAASN